MDDFEFFQRCVRVICSCVSKGEVNQDQMDAAIKYLRRARKMGLSNQWFWAAWGIAVGLGWRGDYQY